MAHYNKAVENESKKKITRKKVCDDQRDCIALIKTCVTFARDKKKHDETLRVHFLF